MKVFTAPKKVHSLYRTLPSVFLAGSIEMDKAELWQDRVIAELSQHDIVVFNPRREAWDSSWKQEAENPQFNEQVNWELDNLDAATYKFFYFDPNTKSPITLMELGYVIGRGSENVIVVCPPGFWRRGNVEIICSRNDIYMFDTLEDGLAYLVLSKSLDQ